VRFEDPGLGLGMVVHAAIQLTEDYGSASEVGHIQHLDGARVTKPYFAVAMVPLAAVAAAGVVAAHRTAVVEMVARHIGVVVVVARHIAAAVVHIAAAVAAVAHQSAVLEVVERSTAVEEGDMSVGRQDVPSTSRRAEGYLALVCCVKVAPVVTGAVEVDHRALAQRS